MRRVERSVEFAVDLFCLLAVLAATPGKGSAQRAAAGAGAGPTVAVLPFDFAAPGAAPEPSVLAPRGWRDPRAERGPTTGAAWPVARMGAAPPMARHAAAGGSDPAVVGVGDGVSALLVERLLATGGIRVVEREHLDAVLAERGSDASRTVADYVVTGAIVEFGVEESHAAGVLGRRPGLGGLGLKRPTTTVTLVARVVSTRTGEVVLALRGQGISRKGGGLTLGGIMRGAGGIFSVGSKGFRESALGEATARAVDELAGRIVERRALLEAH